MAEFSAFNPDLVYVVGFEGSQNKAPVTFGSAAMVRKGRLYNAASGYSSPLEELADKDLAITRMVPHVIAAPLAELPCFVLRVKTDTLVGAMMHATPNKMEMDEWYDITGWTYYLFGSMEQMDYFINPFAERLVDWAHLPGVSPETKEEVLHAARVLDHRIGNAEFYLEDGMEAEITHLPDGNRPPAHLMAKVRNYRKGSK